MDNDLCLGEIPPLAPTRGRTTFAPGQGGRPKGTMNRLTRLIKEQLSAAIESGQSKHPAMILLAIANDDTGEIPINVRRAAATDLLPYLLPMKHSLEIEPPDPADEERIQTVKKRLATLWIEEITTNDSPRQS
jgi:hypothetical protein